jgi:hypothetical protein
VALLEQLALDLLERDRLLEAADANLLGEEDLGHATGGEPANDLVLAEHVVGRRRRWIACRCNLGIDHRPGQQLVATPDDLRALRRYRGELRALERRQ